MRQAKDADIQTKPKDSEVSKPEGAGAAKPADAVQKPMPETPPLPQGQAQPDPGAAWPAPPAPDLGQVQVQPAPPKKAADLKPGDLLEPALWLIVAMLLLAVLFWAVGRWRKREEVRGDVYSEQLTHFRESFEQGEMTEEEYKRIHAHLAGKMQGKPKARPDAPEAGRPAGGAADSPH